MNTRNVATSIQVLLVVNISGEVSCAYPRYGVSTSSRSASAPYRTNEFPERFFMMGSSNCMTGFTTGC